MDNGRSKTLVNQKHVKTLNCIRCGTCMNTGSVYRRSGGYSYTYFIPGPIGINWGIKLGRKLLVHVRSGIDAFAQLLP